MPAIKLLIKGRVQGVFYRASAKEKAVSLGIEGWIRNTADGHVEAYAKGEEKKLESFLGWCLSGPEGAKVTSVESEPADEEPCRGFEIRRG